MDFTDQQCKERKKKGKNGRKKEKNPGFIPYWKSLISSLYFYKSQGTLQIWYTREQFSSHWCRWWNNRSLLPSCSIQTGKGLNPAWNWEQCLSCPSPANSRGMGAKSREGTMGSEWSGRSWGASQGHPLAAQSQWAKESTCQDLPHPVASILVRRNTNLTIFPFNFFIIWGMHEEITWSVQPNSHKLREACGLNFTAFSYH